ncbi:enoyl-CoA hydratase [Ralstonia sp. A12]|uniref:enoyl-CoA hydratase n=1 Tax=Ralstonia sp. A12 TaxID=1217052 RepID=UPI000575B9BB|nr:enoyl-CoA hydratase [Ralstonia sp. A12]KHK52901.1 enoyl-CoA hydratase [Ralstonia sp. A12]
MSEHIQSHIQSQIADGVLTLTLARADKKNAITDAMYGALADALDAAERDSTVRVVLLRAEGDMFSAGNDIGEFASIAMTGGKGDGERNVIRFLHALARATRPLVAAVQGRAVGIGTTMLLHCDFVLLADNAQLSTPFVNLALVPEAASSLLMPARLGHVRAFEMFALGDAVSAESALAWGLANRVVPLYQLGTEAEAIAARLARQPLGALTETKRLMRDAELLKQQMDVESASFAKRLKSPEAHEAFRAFVDRRPPNFNAVAH